MNFRKRIVDRTQQLDAVMGCAELQVPKEHLARRVRELVAKLDELMKKFSNVAATKPEQATLL